FDHLLTSSTEVSKNLPENIRMFRELIHDCHLLIAADADASGMTWDLINKLKGGKSYYVKNHYKHSGRTIIKWKNYYEMINVGLLKVAKSNTKKGIFITTQGGKEGSRTGAYTLEDVLAGNLTDEMEQDHNNAMDAYKLLECSGRKIWVITARTISDKNHPCFQVIKDEKTFNSFIHRAGENGDIVIISNVIPTGFSIDEPHNFGYQFSFGTGVNNAVGFVQHINRLRGDDVERHIAIATRSSAKYGNGSSTYKGILAGINYVSKSNKLALKEWFDIDVDDIQEDGLFAVYSAKIFARNNAGFQDYASWVAGTLKYRSGYKIIDSTDWLVAKTESFDNPSDGEITYTEDELVELTKGIKPLKQDIKVHAAKDMIRRYQRVVDQKPCSPDEYKYLQEKKRKGVDGDNGELERLTPNECDRLLRAEFVEHSGGTLPITAENLKKYDQEGFLGKLRLFHYATKGKDQVGELSALAIERNVKNKQHVARKTNSKVMVGKLKFLSDNGFDDLLELLYEIILNQNPDQKNYINNRSRFFDQNFDQFFALRTPKDQDKGNPSDCNDLEMSNNGSGNALGIEILANGKGFELICQNLRKSEYACKQLLGFKPAEKYNISLIKQFLGIFGIDVTKKGSTRRNEKYFLDIPPDAHLYLKHLQERSQLLSSPENQKILDLILDKSDSKDCSTSYVKDAVAGLPALTDLATLPELVEWGSFQRVTYSALEESFNKGYEIYLESKQELIISMQHGDDTLNRIISDGIDLFENLHKDKIAVAKWKHKQDYWTKEIANCNPAALLIQKMRNGVDATRSFLEECRTTYQMYFGLLDDWVNRQIISPGEYLAMKGDLS
ncbi:MAG: hypothetical protein ACKPE3_11200, partial [Sphaerospermopsis kisseleviana]